MKKKRRYQPRPPIRKKVVPKKKPFFRNLWCKFSKTFVALSIFFSLAIGIMWLFPDLEIIPGEPINPNITFSVPFYICNNGNLPIKTVGWSVLLISIKPADNRNLFLKDSLIYGNFEHLISPNKRKLLLIDPTKLFSSATGLLKGQIAVIVKYKLLYLFSIEHTTMFTALVNNSGKIYWLEVN